MITEILDDIKSRLGHELKISLKITEISGSYVENKIKIILSEYPHSQDNLNKKPYHFI